MYCLYFRKKNPEESPVCVNCGKPLRGFLKLESKFHGTQFGQWRSLNYRCLSLVAIGWDNNTICKEEI